MIFISQWTYVLNWTYIIRSCDVKEVILAFYVRLIKVICPLDCKNMTKLLNGEHVLDLKLLKLLSHYQMLFHCFAVG